MKSQQWKVNNENLTMKFSNNENLTMKIWQWKCQQWNFDNENSTMKSQQWKFQQWKTNNEMGNNEKATMKMVVAARHLSPRQCLTQSIFDIDPMCGYEFNLSYLILFQFWSPLVDLIP